MTLAFADTEIPEDDFPQDSIPDVADVEYPCQVCGQEAGPYGGRGRKPTRCPLHKKNPTSSTRKVTGSSANLATQATASLVQINGLLTIGAMTMGMVATAQRIAQANPIFEEQAYNALVTDPELCKLILKSGAKSAKISLMLAYGGLLTAVAPVAYMEIKEKQAERAARKAEEEGV